MFESWVIFNCSLYLNLYHTWLDNNSDSPFITLNGLSTASIYWNTPDCLVVLEKSAEHVYNSTDSLAM